ncbi:MAG: xanthine dehydrogenase family protein molybdopterin-binding subunit [Candidatus Caldarchaeum sp.]
MRFVGKAIPSLEGLQLVKGAGRYVGDENPHDVLCLRVVRSPYAHARLKKIDYFDALKKALLIILPRDMETLLKVRHIPAVGYEGARMAYMPVLAYGKVKFVGQPVLGVVARNEYEAEDVAELVSIEYDPLEPVLDPRQALSREAPIIHEELGTNICLDTVVKGGDVEGAFRSAEVVVEDELHVHEVIPSPLETRRVVVNYDGDRIVIHIASQGVQRFRKMISEALGLPFENIRVVQQDVGGAFGSKGAVYPEYILTIYASLVLKRPVKWVEKRAENLIATHHGRGVSAKLSLAATRKGIVLGIKGEILSDLGAFNHFINISIAPFIAQQITGPYSVGAASIRVTSVFTNKTPKGPYRGAGRPEAAFFHERMMDLLADELGMDPLELRKRNLVKKSQMPYKTPLGIMLDPADYLNVLHEASRSSRYEEVKRWAVEERRKGRRVGVGAAAFIDICRSSHGEGAFLSLRNGGRLIITTGSGPQGQGLRTIYAQLAADELGLRIEDVETTHPDSDLLPEGIGTFGSRSVVIGGAAVIQAARELKRKLKKAAAAELRADEEDLIYEDGSIRHAKMKDLRISIRELVERRADSFDAYVFYKGDDIVSFGVHIVVVEVDEEVGAVKVLKYFSFDDVGRVINPLLADAQVVGGVLQGVAQVLYEEAAYDMDGQLMLGGIGDAGLPSAVESIDVMSKLLENPSSYPHGARGVGEAGTIGALPALVKAVEDAVGVRIRSTRLKQQCVWMLQRHRGERPTA